MSDDEKRPTQARLVLPPEQLEEVRQLARSQGLGLAAWFRVTVLKELKAARAEGGR